MMLGLFNKLRYTVFIGSHHRGILIHIMLSIKKKSIWDICWYLESILRRRNYKTRNFHTFLCKFVYHIRYDNRSLKGSYSKIYIWQIRNYYFHQFHSLSYIIYYNRFHFFSIDTCRIPFWAEFLTMCNPSWRINQEHIGIYIAISPKVVSVVDCMVYETTSNIYRIFNVFIEKQIRQHLIQININIDYLWFFFYPVEHISFDMMIQCIILHKVSIQYLCLIIRCWHYSHFPLAEASRAPVVFTPWIIEF